MEFICGLVAFQCFYQQVSPVFPQNAHISQLGTELLWLEGIHLRPEVMQDLAIDLQITTIANAFTYPNHTIIQK